MTRRMTERERQEFLAEPHIGVLSVACDGDRPPLSLPVGADRHEAAGTFGPQVRRPCPAGRPRPDEPGPHPPQGSQVQWNLEILEG